MPSSTIERTAASANEVAEALEAVELEDPEITFEELAVLNDRAEDGVTYEFYDGKPVANTFSIIQSRLLPKLSAIVGNYLENNPLGNIYARLGIILKHDPKIVLVPNLCFIGQEKLAANPEPKKGYWQIVPDIAVEIVSPGDEIFTVFEKAEFYVSFGVREVWIVIAPAEAVIIYRSKRAVRYLVATETLESAELLPGFKARVADLCGVKIEQAQPEISK